MISRTKIVRISFSIHWVRVKRWIIIKILQIVSLITTNQLLLKNFFHPKWWVIIKNLKDKVNYSLQGNLVKNLWTDSFPVELVKIFKRSLKLYHRKMKKNKNIKPKVCNGITSYKMILIWTYKMIQLWMIEGQMEKCPTSQMGFLWGLSQISLEEYPLLIS